MFRCAILALVVALVPAGSLGRDSDSRNTNVRDPNTRFDMPRYRSRADWESRKAHLRKQILSAAGLLPLPARHPLRPRFTHRTRASDYSVDAVLLETLPGYYLGGNLYRPARNGKKLPAVLVPHGHWKRGRLEHQESYSVPALGVNLARQGYVVFAYDMVGYNDTRQTPHSFGGPVEQLWSFHPLGLQLWNSIRAVDFLQSLPEVDAARIAATGASGGGTQTFLLAAVDDRIGYAAPVNMVSAFMQGGDPCEEAPNLRLGTFNVEFAAMMAPRPMLLVSSTGDWTRNTPREEFPAIRAIYRLYGAEDRVHNVHLDAGHNYNADSRTAVYRFLATHLHRSLPAAELSDHEVSLASLQHALLALGENGPPDGAVDLRGLFLQWKAAAMLQNAEIAGRTLIAERLRYAMGVEWPVSTESQTGATWSLLSRAGEGDRIPARWMPGKGDPALIIHPDGSEAALRTSTAARLAAAGRPLLAIDAFQTGHARAPRYRWQKYFLSYNQSDDANRVQDILTALSFLDSQTPGRLHLIGIGRAGVWCLFAAAVAPVDIELTADLDGFSGSDEDFLERFFVPGIQRAGGLPAALKLVKRFRAAPGS